MEQASQAPLWTTILVLLAVAWTLPWKGVALWKSARNGSMVWFVVLLIFNTLAILEILYIFVFSKKKTQGS
jgi:methionyl-tRNA synthetase